MSETLVQLSHGESFDLETITYSPEQQEDIQRSREALHALSKAFETYWVPVGLTIDTIRRAVMRVLKLNQVPRGNTNRYSTVFGAELKRQGYGPDVIDGAARKRLLDCIDHLGEITAWRATLLPEERTKWNHPTVTLREFRKSQKPPKEEVEGEVEKPKTLKESNAELHERLHQAEEQIKQLTLGEAPRLAELQAERDTWKERAEQAEHEVTAGLPARLWLLHIEGGPDDFNEIKQLFPTEEAANAEALSWAGLEWDTILKDDIADGLPAERQIDNGVKPADPEALITSVCDWLDTSVVVGPVEVAKAAAAAEPEPVEAKPEKPAGTKPIVQPGKGECSVCGMEYALTKTGGLRPHHQAGGERGAHCPGNGLPPAQPLTGRYQHILVNAADGKPGWEVLAEDGSGIDREWFETKAEAAARADVLRSIA